MKTPKPDAYAPINDQTSQTDNQRIKDITVLPPPEHLIRFFPIAGTTAKKPSHESAALIFFGIFAIGVLAGTMLHGGGKGGSAKKSGSDRKDK